MAIGLWSTPGMNGWTPSEPTYGGIACSQVREIAPAYVAGRARPDVADKVREHIEQCPVCRMMVDRLRGTAAVAYGPAGGHAHGHEAVRESVVAVACHGPAPHGRLTRARGRLSDGT